MCSNEIRTYMYCVVAWIIHVFKWNIEHTSIYTLDIFSDTYIHTLSVFYYTVPFLCVVLHSTMFCVWYYVVERHIHVVIWNTAHIFSYPTPLIHRTVEGGGVEGKVRVLGAQCYFLVDWNHIGRMSYMSFNYTYYYTHIIPPYTPVVIWNTAHIFSHPTHL